MGCFLEILSPAHRFLEKRNRVSKNFTLFFQECNSLIIYIPLFIFGENLIFGDFLRKLSHSEIIFVISCYPCRVVGVCYHSLLVVRRLRSIGEKVFNFQSKRGIVGKTSQKSNFLQKDKHRATSA